MLIRNLTDTWKTSSILAKVGMGAAVLVVVVLIVGGTRSCVSSYKDAQFEKKQAELKEENQRVTDSYNQALGQAKANEQAAREEKAKADAIIATIEARTTNVKLLDDKLEQVNQKYEKAKSELGDCANTDDCLKRLCLELKAAGFKTPDCE